MTQTNPPLADTLLTLDQRIAWVLDNPGMSPWLKSAVRSALVEDPVTMVNDLEILAHLIGPRARAFSAQPPKHAGPTTTT